MVLLEHARRKQLACWAEPFVRLRIPKMFNLRRDPFERADESSNTYYDWMISHAYLVYAMQAVVASQIENFKAYPPRQKPASFNLDAVMRQLDDAGGGAHHWNGDEPAGKELRLGDQSDRRVTLVCCLQARATARYDTRPLVLGDVSSTGESPGSLAKRALVQVSAASEKRRSRRYLIERKGLRSKQPAIMVAAFPKRLKPSIALTLDLMLR